MQKNPFKLLYPLIMAPLLFQSVFQSAFGADLLTVYNEALRSDPVSKVAELQLLTAQEVQQQAEARLYPQANISANWSKNELKSQGYDTSRYDGTSLKLNIEQVLFDIQSWRDNEKYQLLIDKSDNAWQQAQSELIVKVVELYFSVLEARDTLTLTRKNTQTIAKNLEQLKALYARQLVPITGVYEAEARLDLAKSSEIEAQAALMVAYERLYEVTGKRLTDLAALRPGLQFVTPDDTIQDWLTLAMEKNPEIAASQSSVAAAKKDLSAKKAARAPRFSVGFVQSRQDTGYDNSPRPLTNTSTLYLSVQQPLYQGGGLSARKRESAYRLETEKQIAIETRRRVEQQLREHYLNLQSAVLKIQATARRIASEKKRAESMKASFKYGSVTVNDVLNADTDYLKAQLEHQRAKYNYIKNRIKLKSTAGVVTEKDILELNNWVN